METLVVKQGKLVFTWILCFSFLLTLFLFFKTNVLSFFHEVFLFVCLFVYFTPRSVDLRWVTGVLQVPELQVNMCLLWLFTWFWFWILMVLVLVLVDHRCDGRSLTPGVSVFTSNLLTAACSCAAFKVLVLVLVLFNGKNSTTRIMNHDMIFFYKKT